MTPKDIAREKIISSALRIVQARVWESISDPGPYDDAEAEYADDLLDQAVKEYVQAES